MRINNWYGLLVVLIVLVVLAACGPGDEPTSIIEGEGGLATSTPPPQATGLPAPTPTAAPAAPAATQAPLPEPEPQPQLLWTAELKQALAAAIDREALVDRIFEGQRAAAYHVIPIEFPFFNDPFFERYGVRDLDFSIQRLRELGYSQENPFQLDLWYLADHPDPVLEGVLQILKEQLEETDLIQVHLQPVQSLAEFEEHVQDGQIPFFLTQISSAFADPYSLLSLTAACEGSAGIGAHYCDSLFEDLLDQAATRQDEQLRAEDYEQVAQLYAEQIPVLPLYWEAEHLAYRAGLAGVEYDTWGALDFSRLGFAETALPASGARSTLIIGTTAEYVSQDPQQAYGRPEQELLLNTGLPLMRFIPGEPAPLPYAAEDFPLVSDDGLVYTFTLRPGLSLHNDEPLTAGHYVTAWNRLQDNPEKPVQVFSSYIERFEAVDERSLVVHLARPYPFLPVLLSSPYLIPVESAGAYRVSDVSAEQITLEAGAEAARETPGMFATILIRRYSTSQDLAEALEAGEIDLAWRTLQLEDIFRLNETSDLTVAQINLSVLNVLVFNHQYYAREE
jgi:peptide/nickel transport system substrate-binding protein